MILKNYIQDKNKYLTEIKNFLLKDDSCKTYGLLPDYDYMLSPESSSMSSNNNFYNIYDSMNDEIEESISFIQLLQLIAYWFMDKKVSILQLYNKNQEFLTKEIKRAETISTFYNSGVVNNLMDYLEQKYKVSYLKYIVKKDEEFLKKAVEENLSYGYTGFYKLPNFEIYKKAMKSLKRDFEFNRFCKTENNLKNEKNEEKKLKFFDGLYQFKDKNKAIEYLQNTNKEGIYLCCKKDETTEKSFYLSTFFYAVKYNNSLTLVDLTKQFLTESRKDRTRSPGRRLEDQMDKIILPFEKLFDEGSNNSDGSLNKIKDLTIFKENDDVKILGSILDFSEEEQLFNFVVIEEIKRIIESNDENKIKDVISWFLFKNNIKLEPWKPIKLLGDWKFEKNKESILSEEDLLNEILSVNLITGTKDIKKEVQSLIDTIEEDMEWLYQVFLEEFPIQSLVSAEELNALIPDEYVWTIDLLRTKIKFEYNDKIYNYFLEQFKKDKHKYEKQSSVYQEEIISQILYDKLNVDFLNSALEKGLFQEKQEGSTRDFLLSWKIPLSYIDKDFNVLEGDEKIEPLYDKWLLNMQSSICLFIDKDKKLDYRKEVHRKIDVSHIGWDSESELKRKKKMMKAFRSLTGDRSKKYAMIYLKSFRALWNLFWKEESKEFPFVLKTMSHFDSKYPIWNTILDDDINPLMSLQDINKLTHQYCIIFPIV